MRSIRWSALALIAACATPALPPIVVPELASSHPMRLVGEPTMQVDACAHLGPKEEVALFEAACGLLHGEGCSELALRYYCGRNVERDVLRAARAAQRACDLAVTIACKDADDFFREAGIEGERRPPHGIAAADMLARPSVAPRKTPAPPGCVPAPRPPPGRIEVTGDTIRIPMSITRQMSAEESARWVPVTTEQCRCGDGVACRALGIAYLHGGHALADQLRGVSLLTEVCDAGDSPACAAVAYAFARGQGAPRDAARAAALLDRACALRYGPACTLRARSLSTDIALLW